MLPDLDKVVGEYETLIDSGDIDRANFMLAVIIGYSAFLWKMGIVTREELSKYFERLRENILEGPDYLNPYVLELTSILSEGLDERLFEELLAKLRMLLREDRFDRLEV